eukprot:scaffold22583_cov106-Cylindrotheca_fusiformis.AAC.15
MPLEQGIICTLRDSFGFIHCAERPQEVFFHYSEVIVNPNDLQIDTEVEFKVGIGSNSSDKKLAAYDIKPLPTGTVVWETEEQPETFFQGFVEKAARQDSRSSVEGTIRVVNKKKKKGSGVDDGDDDDVTTTAAASAAAGGQLIRYRNEDYQASSSSRNSNSNSNRLFRGDLVQFRILMDRRTKQNYGRYIELLQTEKDRKRNEKQQKLLQTAVEEQGIVVSLNNGFGFIKSNKRRDHVYFHYSNLIIPPENEDDDFELQKGQELKFWVVTETEDDNNDNNNNNGNNGNGKNKKKEKRSALNVECLPKGTVVFHSEVAKGIQGIVEICPRPPIGSDDMYGTIRLLDPVWDGEQQVKSVLLEFSDAPGGTYTYNKQQQHSSSSSFTNSTGGGGSVMGLWIENGDTLLFDVVKELADGSYRASPTYHTIGKGGTIIEPSPSPPKDEGDAVSKTTTTTTTTPVVRLCACSLVHRADGVIHTVKENSGYGFLHFSERCIDVHFKTYNFLPDELQSDLRLYLGYDGTPSPTLESGTAVQFDICAHGRVTRGRGGRQQQQQQQMHDRENIKGHRMLLLPRSAVMMEKVVKTQIQGVVKSVDPKQFYSGIVQVEEDLEPMSIEERHPLVAKMIHSFLEESNNKPNGRSSLVFRDVVSVKEDEVVVEMVNLLGGGLLECTHIGMAGGGGGSSSSSSHPGRLCIKRVEQEKEKDDTATAAAEKEEGEEKEEKQKQQKPKHTKKNKSSMMMSVRQVHYDKSSLTDELKEDVPLGKGDVVKMDVHQCRRTGRMIVHNLTVVERNPSPDVDEVATTEGSGMGIVKEVVPKRKFGFITVLDETATKRESLFFHLPEDSKGTMYRKGDEVKFDIGLEKSGKRVALNVELLPKGSIPIKAAANACQGYILMEPTHTSLSDTPLRRKFSHMSTGGSDKSSSGGGGGRWGDVKEDSTRRNNNNNNKTDLHEEGCILLLEDKTGMFKNRKMRKSKKNASDDDAKSLESFDSHDDAKSIESTDSALDDDNNNEKTTNGEERGGEDLHIHLPYKNGAIAIHGSGATSSLDGSTNPRRGDLVSFVKAKKGTTSVRDVRIITRQAAKLIQGRLENIELEGGPNRGKAKFIAATEKEEVYEVDLREVVSCDVAVLKDKQAVEAVLHDGKLYGICRTSDLYLGSKLGTKMLGTKNKERPKLNLSVKKNRGGRIIAQSMMAKGPDGSIGFVNGWTTRKSKYLGETQEKTTG